MLDFLSNILNFTNSKPIFPQRKSKNGADNINSDLEDIEISDASISEATSELQTEAENYDLDLLSDTSESSDDDDVDLDTELETEMNDLLDTDQLSETSYATITELEGGFKNTSFTDIKQEQVSYGKLLDGIISDLDRMLKD